MHEGVCHDVSAAVEGPAGDADPDTLRGAALPALQGRPRVTQPGPAHCPRHAPGPALNTPVNIPDFLKSIFFSEFIFLFLII